MGLILLVTPTIATVGVTNKCEARVVLEARTEKPENGWSTRVEPCDGETVPVAAAASDAMLNDEAGRAAHGLKRGVRNAAR
ncbi:hypothetical protein ACIBEK_15780 [Nocardia fusca]|uniref:hypothetical protein n=1 Tax=Nocardia fusca TaxID=941183 RepID=UPI0037BB7D09